MFGNSCLMFVLLLIKLAFVSPIELSGDSLRSCEPIRIEMCKGLGYNVTGMPNMVGHELQQDAELQLQTFTPLIQYGCSSQLRFFLCAVYTPMCTDKVPQSIGPCRPLCENVKARCQPVLQEFGFPWPSALNCSKFPPENNHKNMCMEGPEPEDHERIYPVTPLIRGPHIRGRQKPKNTHKTITGGPSFRATQSSTPNPDANQCSAYKHSHHYRYISQTQRCAHNCSADILFTNDNKNFADIWIAVWSSLCFLSTLFTLITFLLDSTRFRYPERAIICLAANYNIYSIAYIIRLIVGRSEVSCHVDSQHNMSILIQEGLDNVWCTVIFVMLYFFGMASAVWWVILAFTWFLAAGLHWSPEAIQRKCTFFHIAAWLLPSLKTIAILVMRVVDGDELTGTCYVGNQDKSILMSFVIIPSFIYLILGTFFLLAGVCVKIRSHKNRICQVCIPHTRVRHGSHHSSSFHASHPHLLSQSTTCCHTQITDKLEVLMVRIGIFAVFYIVPATCVLGANLYEYVYRDLWYLKQSSSTSDNTSSESISDRPDVEVFTLKIFMTLVIGIKTGLWIWSSGEPLTTWRKVGKRLVSKKKSPAIHAVYHNANAQHKQLIALDRTKRPRVKGGNETAV